MSLHASTVHFFLLLRTDPFYGYTETSSHDSTLIGHSAGRPSLPSESETSLGVTGARSSLFINHCLFTVSGGAGLHMEIQHIFVDYLGVLLILTDILRYFINFRKMKKFIRPPFELHHISESCKNLSIGSKFLLITFFFLQKTQVIGFEFEVILGIRLF